MKSLKFRHFIESILNLSRCVLAIKGSLRFKAAENVRIDNGHKGARLMSVQSLDQNLDWFDFGSTFLRFTRKQFSLPSHMFSLGILNHMDAFSKCRIQELFTQVYLRSNRRSKAPCLTRLQLFMGIADCETR